MPRKSAARSSAIEQVVSVMRTSHTYVAMSSQAAAERIGINTTDLHCLNIVAFSDRELNAGDLARITSLTTASITGVLDRLERAGLVQRTRDPVDRRRVVVRLVPEVARERVAPVFAPMLEQWHAELAGYDDDELAVILRFQQRMLDLLVDQVAELRQSRPPARLAAPTGPGWTGAPSVGRVRRAR